MSGGSRDVVSIQTELNRHSLVEIGKRLTKLEQKFVALEEDAKDLKFFTNNSLETAKRIQKVVKRLVDKHEQEKP
jgi:hypothetical protein